MATALASMLDMQIRVAMSKENPLAVYFPELGFKGKIMIGYLNPDVKGIRAIMRQPQSMAQSSTWVNQVGVIFGLGDQPGSEMWRNEIGKIYRVYEQKFNPIWESYDRAASKWRRENPELREDPVVSLDVMGKIMIEKLQETADQIRRTAVPDDLLTFPGITAFLNLPEGAERQLIVARARTRIPKLAQESFLTRIQFVVNGLSRRTD